MSGAFIPKDSLALSGFGDTPMKFLSVDGVDLGVPTSAPTIDPGNLGLSYYSTGGYWDQKFVYDTDFNVIHTNNLSFRGSGQDEIGNVYSLGAPAGVKKIFRVNSVGVVINTFTTAPAGMVFIDTVAVNDAGTLAYISYSTSDKVWSYNLAGSADIGVFATETGSTAGANSIKVLPNGDVLIGWGISGSGPSYVKRYNSAGALQATYTLPGGVGRVNCVQLATNKLSFFANYGVATSYFWGFAGIRISDGAVLHQFIPPDTGFEWDGPFIVVQSNIGTPVTGGPGPGPNTIPKADCLPTTIVSSPARSSGCNQGGVGWTSQYTLPSSGVMPIGADPTDGELLTGKRVIHVWGELTHTNY